MAEKGVKMYIIWLTSLNPDQRVVVTYHKNIVSTTTNILSYHTPKYIGNDRDMEHNFFLDDHEAKMFRFGDDTVGVGCMGTFLVTISDYARIWLNR